MSEVSWHLLLVRVNRLLVLIEFLLVVLFNAWGFPALFCQIIRVGVLDWGVIFLNEIPPDRLLIILRLELEFLVVPNMSWEVLFLNWWLALVEVVHFLESHWDLVLVVSLVIVIYGCVVIQVVQDLCHSDSRESSSLVIDGLILVWNWVPHFLFLAIWDFAVILLHIWEGVLVIVSWMLVSLLVVTLVGILGTIRKHCLVDDIGGILRFKDFLVWHL